MYHRSLKKQRGIVIVVALFIVALVATMAYVMMARLARDTERTRLLVQNTQAQFYAQGSLAWAIDQLRNDWDRQQPNMPVDAIPLQSPVNQENGYQITSNIDDMQARFNLNNLIEPAWQSPFVSLLHVVMPTLNVQTAKQIATAITAWITPGNKASVDDYYLNLSSPYRPAHQLMQSASELKLLQGMTPAIYEALKPYVVALPKTTPINVQTAEAPLLLALSPALTVDAAKAIIAARKQKPIVSTQAFTALSMMQNHAVTPDFITTVSQFFLVQTDVKIDEQHLVIYTLLDRSQKDGKAQMNILWQSKGVW